VKNLISTLIVACIVFAAISLPLFETKISFNVEDITGNFPFAGKIELNGDKYYVSTKTCVSIWMDKLHLSDMPEENIQKVYVNAKYSIADYISGNFSTGYTKYVCENNVVHMDKHSWLK